MNTNLLTIAARLSDDALDAKLQCLAQGSRHMTVELIAHLAEFTARKLHRAKGPGRLFGYCTQILRFSEAAAYNRIKAAKAARKFPVILDLLTDGSVNLTTIRLLAPHLTVENHLALLEEAKGMTRRQVDKVVARLAPKPDVPASIRKLPAPRANVPGEGAVTPATPARSEHEATTPTTPQLTTQRPVVAPLSPERYRLQVTIGEEAHDDLRFLQDLMRREIPDGDPAVIVARALKLLRQAVQKRGRGQPRERNPGRGTSLPTSSGPSGSATEASAPLWQRTVDGARSAVTSSSTTSRHTPSEANRQWTTSRSDAGNTTSTSPS